MMDNIEQEISDIDNKIKLAIDNLNTVQIEQATLRRSMFEISESVRIAKHNLARLKIDKQIKERMFWANKNGYTKS